MIFVLLDLMSNSMLPEDATTKFFGFWDLIEGYYERLSRLDR